jgi:hypothetical protein
VLSAVARSGEIQKFVMREETIKKLGLKAEKTA